MNNLEGKLDVFGEKLYFKKVVYSHLYNVPASSFESLIALPNK